MAKPQELVVASKLHSESRLLAEITAQLIEQKTDLTVKRKFGLGGTLICFKALQKGDIDIYPEYTGTAATAILNLDVMGMPADSVYAKVALRFRENYTIVTGPSFGFNNTYVLATRRNIDIAAISELRGRNDLKFGFSNEFIERPDGFPGLNAFYGLNLKTPRGIDHGLAYRALAEGEIDVTDAYSTDGKLEGYNFNLLKDDRNFFPPYYAVPLVNASTYSQHPELKAVFESLGDILNEDEMRKLNRDYEVKGQSLSEVAFKFLSARKLIAADAKPDTVHPVVRQTLEHIRLTFIATFLSILLAVPLGIFIQGKKRLASVFISATGLIQTIPSLALLGFMIPLFGIGFVPAIIALFLYALLPILRNTYTGLQETDPILIDAGRAMGMSRSQILFQIRLPLAVNVIMAGVRTALIINIGTATLAAFIGAGGLGESIITGISLNDNAMILRGAIPAAVLALVADRLMAFVEKAVKPKGIKSDQ